MDLKISTLTLEAFLLVVVRTGCFIAVAPIFGHKSVNAKLRVLIAICMSFTTFSVLDITMPEYYTVLDYTLLVIKEALCGLSLGFVSSLVMAVISFAGEFIDREIGFSMVTNFNPSMGTMVTITAELYDKLVCLVIMVTNLHYYILKALAQSFVLVPIGDVDFNFPVIYSDVVSFISQYFSIGIRIAMPIFIGVTMLNVILGVLAKSAPQMNMFAIGIQLKLIVGMLILTIAILFIPNITEFVMDRMQTMLSAMLGGL